MVPRNREAWRGEGRASAIVKRGEEGEGVLVGDADHAEHEARLGGRTPAP